MDSSKKEKYCSCCNKKIDSMVNRGFITVDYDVFRGYYCNWTCLAESASLRAEFTNKLAR